MRKPVESFIAGAVFILMTRGLLAAPGYGYYYTVGAIHVVDLGTLGGSYSNGWGINDLGDVVGSAQDPAGKYHAFIHTNGQMFSLDAGGTAFDAATASGINNTRTVVGNYNLVGSFRSFYYYPGIWMTPMSPDPYPSLGYIWLSGASAINNSGRIVGRAQHVEIASDVPKPNPQNCYDTLPAQWASGSATPTGLFCPADPDGDGYVSGSIGALDINDSGNVVGGDGWSSTHSMFLLKNGIRYAIPAPAGLPETQPGGGQVRGHAQGINNQNWVVGDYEVPDDVAGVLPRAFIWDGLTTNTVSLGLLPNGTKSSAWKINEARMVAGYATRLYGTSQVAAGFIWHADFGMKQLPALSYTGTLPAFVPRTCYARGINELKAGLVQIAGECTNSTGLSHAVRWDVTINTNFYPLPGL
jgi:probable HAF family extracellular repeat protein